MTPANTLSKRLPALLLFFLALFPACGKQPPPSLILSGNTMGTTYTVTIANPTGEGQQIQQQIETLLQKINQLMSTYIPDSEISRFNLTAGHEWFQFSPETFAVLYAAQQIAEKTDNAFDITVGPLVDLWGFGPAPRPSVIPQESTIQATQKIIGMKLLELHPETFQAKKSAREVHIDLSAIAKGYAVDAVSELLNSLGLRNHLVEIGGEVIAKGSKDDNSQWRVALETPEDQVQHINRIVELHNLALATSGSYRNYYQENGIRYSHTIDPQTGRPITHNLVSVSVAAHTCMSADAWATALMVLGPERGSLLAEKFHIAAFFTEKSEDTFHSRSTTQWNSFFP